MIIVCMGQRNTVDRRSSSRGFSKDVILSSRYAGIEQGEGGRLAVPLGLSDEVTVDQTQSRELKAERRYLCTLHFSELQEE